MIMQQLKADKAAIRNLGPVIPVFPFLLPVFLLHLPARRWKCCGGLSG